jgi:hypothetical protein
VLFGPRDLTRLPVVVRPGAQPGGIGTSGAATGIVEASVMQPYTE